MGYRRFGRSALRKGKRLYKWGKANPKQAAAMAQAALRGLKYIRGLVNSEMFHHDVGHDATAIPSTGLIYPICDIATGDGDGARTGRSIFVRSLLSRIRITKNDSATTTYIRLMLVQDKQQIADTTPAISDILQYVDVDSPLNLNSGGRFKIMLNRTIALDTNKPTYHTQRYRKLWTHIHFNGDSATDVQRNGLYWVLIADQATNTPTLDYYTRVGYHDN